MGRAALGATIACLTLSSVALAGCGGGHAKPKTVKSTSASSPAPTSPSSSPVPNYTADQVLKHLISAKDVGPFFKQTIIGTRALIDRKALKCSLSGVALPGKPTIGERQYAASVHIRYDQNYAQFIALYPTQADAEKAFAVLRSAAQACPPKQHVRSMQDPTSTATVYEHDDTWTLSPQETLQGWTHLRAWEREVAPLSRTKYKVYFDAYDYVQRGNLVLATLYAEQTLTNDPGDKIKQRADTVLSKQLQALG